MKQKALATVKLSETVGPKLYHAKKNVTQLAEIYRLFPRRITAEVVFPNDVHP